MEQMYLSNSETVVSSDLGKSCFLTPVKNFFLFFLETVRWFFLTTFYFISTKLSNKSLKPNIPWQYGDLGTYMLFRNIAM